MPTGCRGYYCTTTISTSLQLHFTDGSVIHTNAISLFVMVVRLRFAMHGNRHDKLFHIVAINSRKRRNAKPIETLGVYRHTIDNSQGRAAKSVEWSAERIKYWLGVGAQPSKSVVKLCTQVWFSWFRNGDYADRSLIGRHPAPGFQISHKIDHAA